MQYPESLIAIVKEAAAKHQSDIDAAVAIAFKQWKQEEDFAEWSDEIIRGQLRHMIHDARHSTNVAIRRDLGEYGGRAKVGLSDAVNRAAMQSVLDTYSIGGRALGDIPGAELPAMAKNEREKGQGCYRNSRLCSLLAGIVPADKLVRQVVNEKKARLLIQQASGNGKGRGRKDAA